MSVGSVVVLQQSNSVTSTIRLSLGELTTSEASVANWILANAASVPSMSMGQVAAEAGVSDTTVLRLCRRIGFRGFTDLKFRIVEDGARTLGEDSALADQPSPEGVATALFEDCIRGLRDTLQVLGDSLERAVDLIETANEILVVGVGTARPAILAAQSQMFRLGLPCRSQTDSYLQLMEVSLMKPPGLVIAVSYSGASVDSVDTMRAAKERGLSTICITGMPGAPITAFADVCLASLATELRNEPVAGRVVQVALASALARAYADRHPSAAADAEAAAFNAVIDKTL